MRLEASSVPPGETSWLPLQALKIEADGSLSWDFFYSTRDYQQHHDIQPMPGGSVLLIAWELKTQQEAIAHE